MVGVEEGLKEGDKFISTGLTKLMPKMPVKIMENQPEQPSKDEKAQEE